VTHFLSQAESQLFQEFLRIAGGGSIAALLGFCVWSLISGKVIPKWMWDDKCKLLDAERAGKETERLARIAAEARLDQTLAKLSTISEALESLESRLADAQPKKGNRDTRAEASRQEGPRP
jgi:hypothetical protein